MQPVERFPKTHFWAETKPTNLDSWDPDLNPELYQDGFGHSVLELYVRMLRRGLPVTLGRTVPRGSQVVIAFSKHVTPRTLPRLSRIRGHLLVVMSDYGVDRRLPIRPDTSVVPYRACAQKPGDVWIPLLPQRGLIQRSRDRGCALEVIGYFGSRANAPWWLLDKGFERELQARNLVLELVFGDETNRRRWHDFREVDAVLCVRRHGARPGVLSKPPTKLVNAWAAGAIPIIDREPALLELARDEVDALVLDENNASSALEAIDRIRENDDLRYRLYEQVGQRSLTYCTEEILMRWISFLTELNPIRRQRRRIDAVGMLSALLEPGYLAAGLRTITARHGARLSALRRQELRPSTDTDS